MAETNPVNYKRRTSIAGLVVEKHPLALADAQKALASLGVRYNGNRNWRLPRGARIEYVGFDEEDRSDDWILYIEDENVRTQVYYVWSDENQQEY